MFIVINHSFTGFNTPVELQTVINIMQLYIVVISIARSIFFSPPVCMVIRGFFINYCSYMSLLSTRVSSDYMLAFSAIYWS